MAELSVKVWDDSQGWRSGAWRWKVVGADDVSAAIADRDYLTQAEAHLAGCHAKRQLEDPSTERSESAARTDYTQYSEDGAPVS